jgi:hypothetical protein
MGGRRERGVEVEIEEANEKKLKRRNNTQIIMSNDNKEENFE